MLIDFIHVSGHQDKDIPRYLLTREQKLNVDMDTLATKPLRHVIRNGHYIGSTFPWELIVSVYREKGLLLSI